MKIATFLIVTMIALSLVCGANADQVKPVAMVTRDMGGGPLNEYTPGVAGGKGLYNIGLLIRIAGTVTFVDNNNKFFYVDDGFGRNDGSAYKGVRVSYDNLAPSETFTAPAKGSFVAVTGISSTVVINELVQPMLRTRGSDDMQTAYVAPG